MTVGKGALVYNGGGVRTLGTVKNYGNIQVEGSPASSFKVEEGGTFTNHLNNPEAYAGPTNVANNPYTYGQLYIAGIPQSNISGLVGQEYRSAKHGAYQQFAIPFYDKTLSTLSSELGKTFSNARWSENEILVWNDRDVVFKNFGSLNSSKTLQKQSYYILGAKGLDVANTTRTVKGTPFTDLNSTVTLSGAARDGAINFGTGGAKLNEYNEKYNSYVYDVFAHWQGQGKFTGNYGKNLYFFGNPFLINLDLKNLATTGDATAVQNIYGIRLEPTEVQWNKKDGGKIAQHKYVVVQDGQFVGDTKYLLVRPLSTFMIKLKDGSASPQLDLAKLRRFSYTSRSNTPYTGVHSARGINSTIKEIALIGLDNDGNEVGRTYFYVHPKAITGFTSEHNPQIASFDSSIVTFEEDKLNGGYDENHTNYSLYINAANENDFRGKPVKVVKYSKDIASLKVEIKEGGELIEENQHLLSSNVGFYLKKSDYEQPIALKNGDVISVQQGPAQTFDLSYGQPQGFLGANAAAAIPSRTVVVYNPALSNYIVKFDPEWSSAEVMVFDMSGRLVLSQKGINTNNDFELKLRDKANTAYMVKVIGNNGEVVQTKIIN